HADDRQEAGDHAQVEDSVPEDDAPDPRREDRSEAVLRRRRDPKAPEHEQAVEPHEEQRPEDPPLLREDREGEVAVLLVEEEELVLRALHETLAEPAAVADGDARLTGVP